MPIESLVLRERQGDSGDSHHIPTAVQRPSHPIPPGPALNHLIRALEHCPPDEVLSNNYVDTNLTRADDAKVSAIDNCTDTTLDAREDNTEESAKSSDKNKKKKQISGGRKKPTVSDDDDHSQREKKKLKITTEKSVAAMDDFVSTIDDAVRERRIDEKKAERLHECLQAGDWSEVAFSLLCEQIPLKRKGKGYTCRVCLVPKKGHTCLYCHICSTPEEKYKKDDDHVCVNCPVCFEEGKKKKKLIQIKREGHVCPHGPQPLMNQSLK